MTLLSLELFKQDLQQPALLLQQLEQLSQQVTLGAAKLPNQRRQQLRRQVQEVVHDAQQLCRLVAEQHGITGKDPLCRATAAGISMGLMGLDSDGSDDESDEVAGAVDGLNAEAEQQLRRVFAVTDSLSRQQVRCAGVGWFRIVQTLACKCIQTLRGVHISTVFVQYWPYLAHG